MNDADLREYRNRVIEECARVIEQSYGLTGLAAAIRALKDKP